MYSNSKEQVSLEEAYRKVHLEEREESNCDCGCDCKWAKEGCDCGECEGCFKNAAEGQSKPNNEVSEESVAQLTESVMDLVKAGVNFVKDPNVQNVTSELVKWTLTLAATYGTGKLFVHQNEAAQFIAELMEYFTFKNRVDKAAADLKSNDIQRNINGHNGKIRMLRTLDNWLIRKAVKMGLLEDPRKAVESLDHDVDVVEQQIKELEKHYKDQ